jgi:predicted ATP-binding protein involved in virulence
MIDDYRIDRLVLRDVGPFEEVSVEFPRGSDPKRADAYLITGPNGSGKSTLLYAIAAAVSGGDYNLMDERLVTERLRNDSSLVVLDTPRGQLGISPVTAHGQRPEGADAYRFPDISIFQDRFKARQWFYAQGPQLPHFTGWMNRSRFAWCAFAYAGMRSLTSVHLTEIRDEKTHPLQGSLSFIHTADSQRLARWLFNQDVLRLKARANNRAEKAAAVDDSISRIEKAIATVVDSSFRFIFPEDSLSVRVEWQGVPCSFDVLPEGLKSVASWIADLLMRLDGLPWVDDTPILERPFLLLLDEIDLHLHPAWQRRILPMVQEIFPNAQIIASTHSPFVVASAYDSWVIPLRLNNRISTAAAPISSRAGSSYSSVMREIFDITSEFDIEVEERFTEFYKARDAVLKGTVPIENLKAIASDLQSRGEEIGQLVAIELKQLERQLARRGSP